MTDKTTPTNEDRRLARDWAEHIFNTPETSLPMETAAANALMALLLPRPNTLAVGSTWDDAAALTRACDESERDQIVVLEADGYAFIWSYAANWWEGSVPPIDPPYTIIHTGKADQ